MKVKTSIVKKNTKKNTKRVNKRKTLRRNYRTISKIGGFLFYNNNISPGLEIVKYDINENYKLYGLIYYNNEDRTILNNIYNKPKKSIGNITEIQTYNKYEEYSKNINNYNILYNTSYNTISNEKPNEKPKCIINFDEFMKIEYVKNSTKNIEDEELIKICKKKYGDIYGDIYILKEPIIKTTPFEKNDYIEPTTKQMIEQFYTDIYRNTYYKIKENKIKENKIHDDNINQKSNNKTKKENRTLVELLSVKLNLKPPENKKVNPLIIQLVNQTIDVNPIAVHVSITLKLEKCMALINYLIIDEDINKFMKIDIIGCINDDDDNRNLISRMYMICDLYIDIDNNKPELYKTEIWDNYSYMYYNEKIWNIEIFEYIKQIQQSIEDVQKNLSSKTNADSIKNVIDLLTKIYGIKSKMEFNKNLILYKYMIIIYKILDEVIEASNKLIHPEKGYKAQQTYINTLKKLNEDNDNLYKKIFPNQNNNNNSGYNTSSITSN